MKIEVNRIFDGIDWTVKKPFKTREGIIFYNYYELYNKIKPIAINRIQYFRNRLTWVSTYFKDALQECAIVCMFAYADPESLEPYECVYTKMFYKCWNTVHRTVRQSLWKNCYSYDHVYSSEKEEGFTLLDFIAHFDQYKEYELKEFLLPEEEQLLNLVLAGYSVGEINDTLNCNVLYALYAIQRKVAKYFNVPDDLMISQTTGIFEKI